MVVLFVTKDELVLTFAMHWYSTTSVSTTEMNSAMPEYCVRLSIMAGLVCMSDVPLGSVHTMLTVTGISTAGGRLTRQVKLNKDPAKMVSWGGVTITEVGSGTNELLQQ